MKAIVAAFNQEKALVGAFSVIMNLRMDLFQALVSSVDISTTWDPDREAGRWWLAICGGRRRDIKIKSDPAP